ncbi:hypothetical protein Anapl_09322 [Anas platyrhynchos]|uniref:Uncharacterized protein n=1 Tax=Anas platyrhynchos TaxID=8839 RepID=R0LLQ1_ANAPL|nr:hypothetical protein Anapl_09322 [Anas platyrhynchos]
MLNVQHPLRSAAEILNLWSIQQHLDSSDGGHVSPVVFAMWAAHPGLKRAKLEREQCDVMVIIEKKQLKDLSKTSHLNCTNTRKRPSANTEDLDHILPTTKASMLKATRQHGLSALQSQQKQSSKNTWKQRLNKTLCNFANQSFKFLTLNTVQYRNPSAGRSCACKDLLRHRYVLASKKPQESDTVSCRGSQQAHEAHCWEYLQNSSNSSVSELMDTKAKNTRALQATGEQRCRWQGYQGQQVKRQGQRTGDEEHTRYNNEAYLLPSSLKIHNLSPSCNIPQNEQTTESYKGNSSSQTEGAEFEVRLPKATKVSPVGEMKTATLLRMVHRQMAVSNGLEDQEQRHPSNCVYRTKQ